MIRPDWKHKTEHDDWWPGNGDGDFLRHYYNIQIHNKKDLIDVFELFSALNIACPQAKIEWHNKVKDAAVSFKATNDGFRVYGGPNMYEVENRAVATIKAIKDLVKNY